MHYQAIHQGIFLRRPNRFIAHVDIEGVETVCHVKNTGRCRELLVPNSTVYVEKASNPNRKTAYDLIAVEKILPNGEKLLVNMDAQAPNQLFKEWAEAGHFVEGLTLLRPETKWGNSRFDFYWEATEGRRGFVEVKGVTLEDDGHCRFPDAPTERGVKHIQELMACQQEGYQATICFVIQMAGMVDFAPNDVTHPAFGQALRQARDSGVQILAQGCDVGTDWITVAEALPMVL